MKNNTKLIVGISLPLIVIFFVIGSVIFPKMFFNPKYDFVYTVDSYCKNSSYNNCYNGNFDSWRAYKVVDGKIEKETSLPTLDVYDHDKRINNSKTAEISYPTLYRYNVAKDVFSEISLKQAQDLSLTGTGSSPDGDTVSSDSGGGRGLIGEVLGGGGYRYGLYLRNGSMSKKIIVQNGGQQDYYYTQNFRLIGWVK